MKKTLLGIIGASLLAVGGLAIAQTISVPKVTTINPGADLVQVVPNGNPAVGNRYASVAQLFGASGTSTTGLNGYAVPFSLLKNVTGATIPASATTGVFGITITAGTSEYLITEAASSSTVTDVLSYEVVLPASYVAGSDIAVTTNSNYTIGAGTIGTHTLAAAAYLVSTAGVQGSTLIATAAQSVPSSAGTQTFTITGATLSPGSRLFLTLTMIIQDTGGSNVTGRLNSLALS